MTLEDAVDLVLYAFEHGEQGDLFVQKFSPVLQQLMCLAEVLPWNQKI